MKKTTFKRIAAMLATAVMTATCCAVNTSFANESSATLKLTNASGAPGQSVTVDLELETGNLCTGYDVDIEFDSRLSLKNVSGAFATETIGNVVTIINLTGDVFEDNSAASSLTFDIPADANEGETYSLYFSRVGRLSSDNGDLENPSAIGATITVASSEDNSSDNNDSSDNSEDVIYSEDGVSMRLSEASGIAGQTVVINFSLTSGNVCNGYEFDIEYDERLTFKGVKGEFASENIGNKVTVINLTSGAFEDNKPLSSITFEIPADAKEGDVYDINFTRTGRFSSDNGDLVKAAPMGTTIKVLESAKRVTKYMVFVEKVNGLEVPTVGLRGDADRNGKVGISDAIRIAQRMIKKRDLDKAGEFFADVNQDNKVNITDAIYIARYMIASDKDNAWGTMF